MTIESELIRQRDNVSNGEDKRSSTTESLGGTGDGIQHITRLTVQGITYEGIQSRNLDSVIRVIIDNDDAGDEDLTEEDIDNIAQFFTIFQRESRRSQQLRVQGSGSGKGQGQVKNPETDGRLKGNEPKYRG